MGPLHSFPLNLKYQRLHLLSPIIRMFPWKDTFSAVLSCSLLKEQSWIKRQRWRLQLFFFIGWLFILCSKLLWQICEFLLNFIFNSTASKKAHGFLGRTPSVLCCLAPYWKKIPEAKTISVTTYLYVIYTSLGRRHLVHRVLDHCLKENRTQWVPVSTAVNKARRKLVDGSFIACIRLFWFWRPKWSLPRRENFQFASSLHERRTQVEISQS